MATADDAYHAFVDRLVSERQRRDLPVKMLARLIDVPPSTLSGWERRVNRPRGSSLQAWAAALRMEVPRGLVGSPVVQHGTDSGYQTHIAHGDKGDQICKPCRRAHAAALMAWRRANPSRTKARI